MFLKKKSHFSQYKRLLTTAIFIRPIAAGFVIFIGHLSLVYFLNYYSATMLIGLGQTNDSAAYYSIAMKVAALIGYIPCVLTIEKTGRRPVVLITLFSLFILWATLGCFYIAAVPLHAAWGQTAFIVNMFCLHILINYGIRPMQMIRMF